MLGKDKKTKLTKRNITQLICAVLYNCHITGFASGKIYQGPVKGVCVPGLNCYSCPGAAFACPLGSLQTALVSSKYKAPYYVLGVLLIFGALLGRFVCGFLCPFGFLQELMYKIPSKKIKKSKWTKALSYVKYLILLVFVIAIPVIRMEPGFCKYICPAGTLEGGIPLVFTKEALRRLIGILFYSKLTIAILIIVEMVFIYRVFCRFLCPLGAFYSLFHRVSVLGMEVEESKCTKCNACVQTCKMDIKKVGDAECISCGACMTACHACAIKRRMPKT